MGKILSVLIVLFTSLSAFANGYCEGRATYAERKRCQASQVDVYAPRKDTMTPKQLDYAKRVLAYINNNIHIPQDVKKSFQTRYNQTVNGTVRKCSDATCKQLALARLIEHSNDIVNKYPKYQLEKFSRRT